MISPQVVIGDALGGLPADLPVVALWGPLKSRTPVVAIGEAEGAAAATGHLLELGHQTVWHIAGPTGRIGTEERLRGWRAKLRAAGGTPPPPLRGDWSAESGYAAGQLLARQSDATAVFVGNDQMALGVLRALHEAGRRVPDDISVVGFDDVPDAAYFIPPLTTIRQDFAALGRQSVQSLLHRISGGPDTLPLRVTLPTELVIRSSTAPR